jgi:hypothetical protein
MDARGHANDGLDFLGSGPTKPADEWKPAAEMWSVLEEQEDGEDGEDGDQFSIIWGYFENLFHFEGAYFLPGCRVVELHRTPIDLQLAIRKQELADEAGLEVGASSHPLVSHHRGATADSPRSSCRLS